MGMNESRTATSILQSALCLCLSQLLVATSVAAEAQPQAAESKALNASNTPAVHASLDFVKGRRIQLVARDPVSIDAAQHGAPFNFILDKDVTVDGKTVIHAGTPVTGVVAKVNRGSYERDRYGYIDLRLSETGIEKLVVVRIGGIPPELVYVETGGRGGSAPSMRQALLPLVVVGIVTLAILGCAARKTCDF